MCDRRRDLRSIASEVGISFGVVQSILTDLRYVKYFGKFSATTVKDTAQYF